MTYALGEVEGLAKKAARGAGYPWGLAEEAAMATRWLCRAGGDGVGALASLLGQVDGVDMGDLRPVRMADGWRAEGPLLCPLYLGATLSDLGGPLPTRPLSLMGLVAPLLLLPFCAALCREAGQQACLDGGGGTALTDGAGMQFADRLPEGPADVTLTRHEGPFMAHPLATRANPDPAAWASLERFAHRTYAPATDTSRAKGAGAGLSDND